MYGRRRSVPNPRDYKKDISRLQSLNGLTLEDLKKIKRYVSEYPDRVRLVKIENDRIAEENRQIDRENEAAEKRAKEEHAHRERQKDAIRKPIRDRQLILIDYFKASKVWFGGFEAKIGSERYRLANVAKPAYDEYLSLEKKWSDLGLYVDYVSLPKRKPRVAMKKPPADYTVLRISGASLRVVFKDFSLEQIDAEIKIREAGLQKEKDKTQEMKARAASNELEIRAQAKRLRSDLGKQKKLVIFCPYCEGPLDSGNAHLDHIYPVSKGGQSTNKNLVFVCSPCNLKKKMHTLRVFVRDSGYNFDRIASRLEALGKDF